ncbi:hypothetical protein [Dapis sp. BLCC M172]|uniref:hypothetical protein n=1 Tax=Dapis sp. BLCC M172 TaxID=2975281 RepID=UPI003CF49630
MFKPLVSFAILQLAVALPATATSNILYLNSIRGWGTTSVKDFCSTIADFVDNYEDGNVFDVDFVQTHVSGYLASFLALSDYLMNYSERVGTGTSLNLR